MKASTFLLALFLSLFAALAHAEPDRKAIVGKWSFVEADFAGSFDFRANGKVFMKAKKKSMKRGAEGEGTYKWIDDTSIELSVVFDNVPKQMTFAVVKLEPKTLVLTDERGDTKTFTRSK